VAEKGGEPTFANPTANDKVAPISDLPELTPEW
jgi:hypothetical protein